MSDLSQFKVSELQLKLSQVGLPTQGKKAELVERLQQHASAEAAAKAANFPGFDIEFEAKLAAVDLSQVPAALRAPLGRVPGVALDASKKVPDPASAQQQGQAVIDVFDRISTSLKLKKARRQAQGAPQVSIASLYDALITAVAAKKITASATEAAVTSLDTTLGAIAAPPPEKSPQRRPATHSSQLSKLPTGTAR